MYVYRVEREDTHHGYYHQPLVRVVNQRSFSALLKSSRVDKRYKIVKVERALVGDWEDVTSELTVERDPCPACGEADLVPMGGKHRCPECGYIQPCCQP